LKKIIFVLSRLILLLFLICVVSTLQGTKAIYFILLALAYKLGVRIAMHYQ
jgi:hypothetical protein